MQGDKITKQIIEDANLFANSIVEEAKTQANSILNEAHEFSEKQIADATKKIQEYKVTVKEKYETLLKIETKKEQLKNKQQVLQNLKLQAVDFLIKQKKEEKLKFLNKLIKKYAQKGDIVLFNVEGLTKTDLQSIQSVKDLNLKVEKSDLEEEGIILSSTNCDKNLLFSTLVLNAFEENENEIIKILF